MSAAGATNGMQVYRPWGETHYTSGSLLTQYQYTGQWKSASGLYWYNSRWYDSYLNRWTSPDSIIPDPYNSLDWDRYQYVRSNPLKYTDPTGHSVEPYGAYYANPLPEIIIIAIIAIAITADLDRRRGHGSGDYSEASLAECFKQKNLREFSDHQQIDPQEFNDMLDAIYDDLNDNSYRGSWDPARAEYDTPFMDGNPRFGKATHTDQIVCVTDKCSKQSAVNYVGQGMYAAAAGQSLEDALAQADLWNNTMYGHPATKDELYWLEYGYNYYLQLDKQVAK